MLHNISVKKFLLMFNLNLPSCSLGLYSLILSLVAWGKRPIPTSVQPPFRRFPRGSTGICLLGKYLILPERLQAVVTYHLLSNVKARQVNRTPVVTRDQRSFVSTAEQLHTPNNVQEREDQSSPA
ncbi:uncharacterized protein GJ701_004219 isoform 1-T1 [Geothlypis trichas]